MSDRRPEQAVRHTQQLADNFTVIARLLLGWSSRIGQMPPKARPERLVKPPGTSDPTAAVYVGGETAFLSLVDRYLELVADVTTVTRNLGGNPNITLDGWTILNDPPPAGTERWRQAIRDTHHQTILIVDHLDHAWHTAYQQRHTVEADMQVLDEMADMSVTQHLDRISHLNRRSRTLARQLAPGQARQKRMVYCRHHPDREAKYRGKELCGGCYERQRTNA